MSAVADSNSLVLLAVVSARLGADASLIQAAGGNTSWKDGEVLWVKASGLWLRDALTRPLFVPVRLAEVRRRVAACEADVVGGTVLHELAPSGLRPSIETSLHALMPHPVVLHVHAVDAIAWAVRPDAEAALHERLDGVPEAEGQGPLRWAWVPYQRPGVDLTQAVARILAQGPADALLLANHGLVVGGADMAQAESRLARLLERLRGPVRAAPAPSVSRLAQAIEGTCWRLPANDSIHAIATDALNLARARRGVLYPDHVVFLGAQLHVADEALQGAPLQAWMRQQQRGPEPAPGEAPTEIPCIAIPGCGVVVRDTLGEAALEMLACWAAVLQRLPASVEPVYLPAEEAQALAHWEAERFRRQMVR